MAITVINPAITKILLDLGIDPINPYDMDNAEDTYMSAVREGINTIESAKKGEGDRRSRILREEFQGLLARKKGKKVVNVAKLLVKRSVVPTNKIRPQALLPPDQQGEGESQDRIGNVLNSILEVLRQDIKLDKKESAAARKERERQKRIKREKAIESLKSGVGTTARTAMKVVDTLTSPFKAIWDKIINFLKFTVIGVLFNQALNWFGKEENKEKIENLGRFFKDWWPTLLGGFLLFFTPLGSLVSKVAGIVFAVLPKLTSILKSPLFLSSLVIGASAIDAEKRKKQIREELNATKDDSITTVDEFKEQNKNIKEPSEKKANIPFLQGILELGSTPGGMQFNQGGVVPGSGNKDTVPAMLTPGEFVMSKGAVSRFGTGMMAAMNSAGGGTNQGGPMYEGGGLVGDLSSMKEKTEMQSRFLPVKASGMVPVSIPVRIKTESKTIVLPEIKRPRPAVSVREGSTVPVFDIIAQSSSRYATVVALGVEEMV